VLSELPAASWALLAAAAAGAAAVCAAAAPGARGLPVAGASLLAVAAGLLACDVSGLFVAPLGLVAGGLAAAGMRAGMVTAVSVGVAGAGLWLAVLPGLGVLWPVLLVATAAAVAAVDAAVRLGRAIPRERALIAGGLTLGGLIAVAGILLAQSLADLAQQRDLALTADRARSLAALIDGDAAATLTGTRADLDHPGWRRLHRALGGAREATPDCGRISVLRERPDGAVVVLVDGAATDRAGFTPPGSLVTGVGLQEALRSSQATARGPITDADGRWLTGTASVTDGAGRVVAVLRMDLDAAPLVAVWEARRRSGMVLTAALLAALAGAGAALWRERRRAASLAQRQRLGQAIADACRDLVEDADTVAVLARLLPEVGRAAGAERARLVRFEQDDAYAPVRTWHSTHGPDEQSDRIDLGALRRLLGEGMRPGTVGQGLSTAAVIPVPVSGRAWGALILEDRARGRSWDPTELAALRTLGAAIGGSVVRRDYDAQLREAKDQAERGAQAKADFLAGVGQEMRAPLGGILGMSALLAEARPAGEAREQIATVQSCADHMMAMLDDLADYARLEAGRLEIEHIPFDPREVIEDALAVVAGRPHARTSDLACAFSAAVPARVVGDPSRVRHVVVALLDQAVRGPGRSEITVRIDATAEGDHGALQIVIAGTGVAALEARERPVPAVPGLGLVICRRLVELMGGIISIDDQASAEMRCSLRVGIAAPPPARPFAGDRLLVVEPLPRIAAALVDQATALGMDARACPDLAAAVAACHAAQPRAILLSAALPEGAGAARALARACLHGRPTILLMVTPGRPVAADDLVSCVLQRPVRPTRLAAALAGGDEPRASWAATPAQGVRLSGKVLIAEDNDANARVFAAVLTRAGLDVVVAPDGVQAVAACARATFDCILMDIEMPEMDGLTAARLIRSRETAGRHIPIIAVTANALRHDRERTAAAGMDGHLRKPVEPELLLAAVQKALDTRPGDPFLAVGGGTARHEKPTTTKAVGAALDPDVLDRLGRHLGGDGVMRLVAEYDSRIDMEFADLWSALRMGEAEPVRLAAHRLASGAGALGLVRLMASLRSLERTARTGAVPDGAESRIAAEIARARDALRAYRTR
jgi:CheY-like chemotaxis protein/signal transduction histidine kinase/HPt (histidine-containing phosphotransfer) domain-containing protein